MENKDKYEKLEEVFKLIAELNYLEWKKLEHVVNRAFSSKVSSVSNSVQVDTEDLERWLKLCI